MPEVISIPREMMRVSASNWRIRWGGQSTGGDTGGGDQHVVSRFPKWVGQPKVVMAATEVRAWQAMLDMAQGRVHLFRVPMIERMKSVFDVGEVPVMPFLSLTAEDMSNRRIEEPRPTVTCISEALAGARFIRVDESSAAGPIPVGWILSHNDWPFRVTWREVIGPTETHLGVSALRRAIPADAEIDIYATGLFKATSDEGAFPEVVGEVATVSMDFEEFITR